MATGQIGASGQIVSVNVTMKWLDLVSAMYKREVESAIVEKMELKLAVMLGVGKGTIRCLVKVIVFVYLSRLVSGAQNP